MSMLQGSITYRALSVALDKTMGVAKASLIARLLTAVGQFFVRVFGGSLTFGLVRYRSNLVSLDSSSCVARGSARFTTWLRKSPGRVAASARLGVESSAFASGMWIRIVGACVVALGVGRLALALGVRGKVLMDASAPIPAVSWAAVAAALLVFGILLVVAGPRLIPALRSEVIVRVAGRLGRRWIEGMPAARRSEGVEKNDAASVAPAVRAQGLVLWAAVVVAVAAGLLAGLAEGSHMSLIIGAGIVIVIAVLALRFPEFVLVVGCAFPWVDWAARHMLGKYGGVWDDAFLALSIILMLWGFIFLRRFKLWTVPALVPFAVVFVAAIVSVIVRQVPSTIGIYALRVLLQPIMYYFIGFLYPKNKRWVQWAMAVFLMAATLLALHGLFQYLTHAPMPVGWVDPSEQGTISTRAYSIIGNPNGLGAFLLMGSLISLSLAMRKGLQRSQRWVAGVICLINLAGVGVTFSRGAWLGLVAGIIVLLLISYRRYLIALLAVGVLGWFVAPSAFTNRILFAFSSNYVQKSQQFGRIFAWRVAWDYFKQHPFFGLGLGTFGGTVAIHFSLTVLWVDNFYLQMLAEGGLFLLIAFLWLLLSVGKGLVKGFLTSTDPYIIALATGTFGALVAVCIANLTAGVWETLSVGAIFWLLAGMVTSAALHLEPEKPDAEKSG